MGPERLAMGDGEERDADLSAVLVHAALDVHRDGAGALVEDGELWMVIEEARHGDSLLLAPAQHVDPVLDRVQAFFTLLHERSQLHDVEEVVQVLVGLAAPLHLLVRVRINNLIAQAAQRHVWSLRNVEELASWRLHDLATPRWPQLAEDSEETRLAATVRSTHEDVCAGADLERELLHQQIAIGRDERNLVEFDHLVLERDDSLADSNIAVGARRVADHCSFIPARVQVVEHMHQLVHSSRESGKTRHLTTGQHQTTNSLCELHQHTTEGVVVLKEISGFQDLIARWSALNSLSDVHRRCCLEAFCCSCRRTEWKQHKSQLRLRYLKENFISSIMEKAQKAHKLSLVLRFHCSFNQLTLRDQIINDSHANTELEELSQMCRELVEARQNRELLASVSLIERDLLRVGDESAVYVSVFALQLLLLDGQIAGRSTEVRQHYAGQHQVPHDHERCLCANCRSRAINVNEDIEERLAGVGVKIGDALAELVDVGRQQLIGVGDAVVQVCHFVVSVAPEKRSN